MQQRRRLFSRGSAYSGVRTVAQATT
jgi:hypothetical protein